MLATTFQGITIQEPMISHFIKPRRMCEGTVVIVCVSVCVCVCVTTLAATHLQSEAACSFLYM